MSLLKSIDDWEEVRTQYDLRVQVHKELLELHREKKTTRFVELLLGITGSGDGNYSAREHGLGPKILAEEFNLNASNRVFELATKFMALKKDARTVPSVIWETNLRYLKVGVGSEASCMVNPEVCWVANTRTIWTHLAIEHNDNVSIANEALLLYRDGEETSEMAYNKWRDVHTSLYVALTRIAEDGQNFATRAGVEYGPIKYLWADAIATHLYDKYHSKKHLTYSRKTTVSTSTPR